MSGYPEDPSLTPRPPDPREMEMARAAVAVPATFLLLNGLFGLVILGLLSVPFVFQPEMLVDWADKMIANQPASPEKQQAEQDIANARQQLNDKDRRDEIVLQNAVMLLIPALLNLVAVVGALYMRRLSGYGMSIAGAIVSLVPVATGCLCTGIPFGIWALMVLVRPEVKAAFIARRNAPPPNPDDQYMR